MENFKTVNVCCEKEYRDIHFEDEKLMSYIMNLQRCFNDKQNNFCNICYTVYKISNYFDTHAIGKEQKSNEYYDKTKLLAKFGFDKTAISKLTNCYKRFMYECDDNNVVLTPYYENFSSSKLYELLSLSESTLISCLEKKLITSDMAVKEIREKIKVISGKAEATKVIENPDKINNVEDEEIPMAYNPKQHYEFKYFENKTKSQLLNMIWDLQKEYERLKGKK